MLNIVALWVGVILYVGFEGMFITTYIADIFYTKK